MTNYELLEKVYRESRNICDPIDFSQRQKNLVYALADYILEKDNPVGLKEKKKKKRSRK